MSPIRKSIKFDTKLLDKDAIKTINIINKAGYQAYLVGGCVRDLLLGIKPKDFDVATNAKPQQLRKLFRNSRLIGRLFILVHIIFTRTKFIEVATFRAGQVKNTNNGIMIKNNSFGSIEQDAMCRDFSINALYYDVDKKQIIDYMTGLKDIKAKKINIIGNPLLRFQQDPVRIIRAIRFQVKLSMQLSQAIDDAIYKKVFLLKNISPARLYDEFIKLFHNEKSHIIYEQLEKYGILRHLFEQTHKTSFIKLALINTSLRIKKSQSVAPAFIFAVFLWQAYEVHFLRIFKKYKLVELAMKTAANKVIKQQVKRVLLTKWLITCIKDIWLMQHELENINSKKIDELLIHRRFRMAYDFLLLRSQSIDPDLSSVAEFWTAQQK